jgi:L-erythro-3,5-diaminohexanoate dehydrogenase
LLNARPEPRGTEIALIKGMNDSLEMNYLLMTGGVQMTKEYKWGCPYGCHRVIEPQGVLPQAAWKIDNSPEIRRNEILIDVETLNVDAASFKQMVSQCDPDADDAKKEEQVASRIMEIVGERGKMHNPVTGSGGMLLGRIREFGPEVEGKDGAKSGDRICTLVSLSLTPLNITRIKKVHLDKDQVDVEGTAALFETGVFSVLPDDMEDKLALAVLDVAGAPIQTDRLVQAGDTVFILGAGGKSGLMCASVAAKKAGPMGKVIGLAHSNRSAARLKDLGVCDTVLQGDARDAMAIRKLLLEANDGKQADVTINCVSIPGTEMASILCTRDGGKVYFFSMATSFTAAALGAEGVGADVDLIIGNGYAKGHAEYALDLVRSDNKLRSILEEMFLE